MSAPWLASTLYAKKGEKGSSPDQVAQALYNDGLLPEPDVDALWDAIEADVGALKEHKRRAENAVLGEFQRNLREAVARKREEMAQISAGDGGRFKARARAQREYDDVVARYTNPDGTKKAGWMKAPNGKPTNLTERQWVQVRTPSFKRWFGDWEALATRILLGWNEVIDVDVLRTMSAQTFNNLVAVKDKAALQELFKEFGEVKNKDGRIVRFPAKSAGKMIYKKQYARAFKQLFETSVKAFTEKETLFEGHKSHPNVKAYHHYVNKLSTENGVFYVRFTVREDHNGSNVHAAEVTDVAIYDENGATQFGNQTDGKLHSTEGKKPFVDNKLALFFTDVNNISKIVDENGEPLVVYHGTNAEFDEFLIKGKAEDIGWNVWSDPDNNRLSFFSPSRKVADTYGDIVKACFLKIVNPATFDETYRVAPQRYRLNKKSNNLVDREFRNGEILNTTELAFAVKDKEGGAFDGVIFKRDRDYGGNRADETRNIAVAEGPMDSYAVFTPSQIKSATDNIGTFDAENDDIRFKARARVSQGQMDLFKVLKVGTEVNRGGKTLYKARARRPDLVGLHNMSAEGLKGADALGGFAMPSIAITKDAMGHNEFGEVTLLMRPSSFDPQVNRQNRLYSRDAWTPTFPGIVNKANVKQIEKVSERLLKTLPDNVRKALGHNETYRLIYEDGIQETFQSRQTAGDAYGTNTALKAAYLVSKGETVEPVMKPRTFLGRSNNRILSLGEYGLRLINEAIGDMLTEFHSISGAERMDWIDQHASEIEAAFIDAAYESRVAKDPAVAEFTKEEVYGNLFKKNPLGFADVIDLANAVAALRKAMAKGEADAQVVDEFATRRAIDDRVKNHDPAFEAWLDEQYGDPILARGVRNNKDFYTPSGNRRSWDALHDPATLANIVKAMLNQHEQGGGGVFGMNPFGVGAAKFKTFKDVIKNEELLKELPKEELDELTTVFTDKFNDVANRYLTSWQYKEDNPYTAQSRSVESLLEAWIDSKGKFEGLKRELNGYGRTASDELIREFMEVMNGIAKFPTAYFEAKPMRAVGFEEVAAALVPSDVSEETREILKRRGVDVYEYEAGNEASRLAALNVAADAHEGTRFKARARTVLNPDLSDKGNAKAFKKFLDELPATPMPPRLTDGSPKTALEWFEKNIVGKTYIFDIPNHGRFTFTPTIGHIGVLSCESKGSKHGEEKIKKGVITKPYKGFWADAVKRGEITSTDVHGWSESRARNLPMVDDILTSFDVVLFEKQEGKQDAFIFVKKYESKSGRPNTIIMIVNKDGITIGPGSTHVKDMTLSWLSNKKLVITNDGELYNRGKDNSASQAPLLKDNAESNSLNITNTIAQSGESVNENLADDKMYRIGRLYTGAAADYAQRLADGTIANPPSMHYVGTGEGAQVYGWGLYASSLRGIAQWYAEKDAKAKRQGTVLFKGKPLSVSYYSPYNGSMAFSMPKDVAPAEAKLIRQLNEFGGDLQKFIDSIKGEVLKYTPYTKDEYERNISNIMALMGKTRAEAEVFLDGLRTDEPAKRAEQEERLALVESLFEKKTVDAKPHVYEQTFFTNRAEGDESHLLNWDDEVSQEQLEWMREAWLAEGGDFSGSKTQFMDLIGDYLQMMQRGEHVSPVYGGEVYRYTVRQFGSPKAASEFLARAGIDGVKYPVNATRGGDGSDGWNYVSFRDDNISVDHKWVDGKQVYKARARVHEAEANVREANRQYRTQAMRQQIAELPFGAMPDVNEMLSHPALELMLSGIAIDAGHKLTAREVQRFAKDFGVSVSTQDAKETAARINEHLWSDTGRAERMEARGCRTVLRQD